MLKVRLVLIAEADRLSKPFEREIFFAEQGVGRADPIGTVMIGTGYTQAVLRKLCAAFFCVARAGEELCKERAYSVHISVFLKHPR